MRKRGTRKYRFKKRKSCKFTRRNRYRCYTRRIQKGGWGGVSNSTEKNEKMQMMYGGW